MVVSVLVFACSVTASELPVVRANTEIPVELKTEVRSDRAVVGESIVLRTTEGVLIGSNIVIPRGAEVVGFVDSIQRDQNGLHSTLIVRFRQVRWEQNEIDLNAVVSSVESVNQKENLIFRHIHNLFSQKTLLEGVEVHSHVQKDAFTEFASNVPNFQLRPGTRLVLRQIDPSKEPEMMVKNLVLDVNRGWKN